MEVFVKDKEHLSFIGNGQSSVYGQHLYAKYSSHANLRLLNPIYEIEALYVNRKHCRAYVHGHSAGGTNPSLVKMMHFAKPVVAFDCPYNRATMENKGMYCKTATDLAEQISVLKKDYDPVMQEIAQRRYTWATVKKQFFSLFD